MRGVVAVTTLIAMLVLVVYVSFRDTGTEPVEVVEPTIQSQAITAPETQRQSLPSTYKYDSRFDTFDPEMIDQLVESSVISLYAGQLQDWCGNCWMIISRADSGHVMALSGEPHCSDVTIHRVALRADKSEALLVHAILFTNDGGIIGSGAAQISGVCVAIFWLTDDPSA